MFRVLPSPSRHACHRAGARCPLCHRPPLGVWQRRAEVLLALLEDRSGLGALAIQRELRWLRQEVLSLAESLRQAGFTPATVQPLDELARELEPVDAGPLGCWEVTRLWERADGVLRGFALGDDPWPTARRRDTRRFWR